MSKVFWLDVETTGKDSKKCGILQFGIIIQIDGKVVETAEFSMNPGDVLYDPEATKIHGITKEMAQGFDNELKVFNRFMDLLDIYVSRYDKEDKFFFAGYRCGFDWDFLTEFFLRNRENYIMSYFRSAQLDVITMCAHITKNLRVPVTSYTLKAMCVLFEIPLDDAHNAMADIVATFKLYKLIDKEYSPVINIK